MSWALIQHVKFGRNTQLMWSHAAHMCISCGFCNFRQNLNWNCYFLNYSTKLPFWNCPGLKVPSSQVTGLKFHFSHQYGIVIICLICFSEIKYKIDRVEVFGHLQDIRLTSSLVRNRYANFSISYYNCKKRQVLSLAYENFRL